MPDRKSVVCLSLTINYEYLVARKKFSKKNWIFYDFFLKKVKESLILTKFCKNAIKHERDILLVILENLIKKGGKFAASHDSIDLSLIKS